MYETLLRDVKDGIATVTLNRPDAGNAFNIKALHETVEVFEQCNSDESVKVIILTGSGKHFSVGGDITAMTSEGFISEETAKLAAAMSLAPKRCMKPVIAMVNGAAAGAGFGLVLGCDFRIMTEKGKFITSFIDVGISGDGGCYYHLCHLVGLAKATELMMLSTPVKSDDALSLGLATKVVPENKLLEAAMELAETLKAKPFVALSKQKELIYKHFYSDYESYVELESEFFTKSGKTDDHKEAVAAFLEKRTPVFRGV